MRPRPALWQSATAAVPWGAPARALPLQVGVGGVDLLKAPQVRAGDRQIPADLPLRQGVRGGHQAIAQPGAGLNAIALPPQAVHRLPHGGPADPQRPADLLPGAEPLRLPRQQLVHPVPAHRHSPSLVRDLISLDSIPFPPGFVNGGGALFPEKRIDPPGEA